MSDSIATGKGLSTTMTPRTSPCETAGTANRLRVSVLVGTGIAAMFVLPRVWTDGSTWNGSARATRYIRPAAVVGLVWFMATQAFDRHSAAGIAQRLLAASVLTWIGVIGWALARSARHESAPTPS